jgi:hypothetical protein
MKTVGLRSFSILILSILFAGCAQQTEIVKLYDDTANLDRQYQKIFVVAIASNPGTRQRLEDMITAQLREQGVSARPAYSETGSKTTLLQEEINKAAENYGADAILITHIVSVDTKADIEKGRVDIVAECRGGDPADYFLYDYEELKVPDTVRLAHTVVAVTNLYDAGEARRVWTIQSTCFEKATMDEVLLDEARAIARQLKIDKLIN